MQAIRFTISKDKKINRKSSELVAFNPGEAPFKAALANNQSASSTRKILVRPRKVRAKIATVKMKIKRLRRRYLLRDAKQRYVHLLRHSLIRLRAFRSTSICFWKRVKKTKRKEKMMRMMMSTCRRLAAAKIFSHLLCRTETMLRKRSIMNRWS